MACSARSGDLVLRFSQCGVSLVIHVLDLPRSCQCNAWGIVTPTIQHPASPVSNSRHLRAMAYSPPRELRSVFWLGRVGLVAVQLVLRCKISKLMPFGSDDAGYDIRCYPTSWELGAQWSRSYSSVSFNALYLNSTFNILRYNYTSLCSFHMRA